MFDETFWVAVAFVLLIGVFLYYKVPAMIGKQLDERAAKIKQELDEAAKLHSDAQALFADYQRKQKNALKEAQDIVAQAEAEAKRITAQAAADTEAMLKRGEALAQAKIAQAEAAAVKEIRDAAADLAVEAAKQVLTQEIQGPKAQAMVDKAIADLRGKLH